MTQTLKVVLYCVCVLKEFLCTIVIRVLSVLVFIIRLCPLLCVLSAGKLIMASNKLTLRRSGRVAAANARAHIRGHVDPISALPQSNHWISSPALGTFLNTGRLRTNRTGQINLIPVDDLRRYNPTEKIGYTARTVRGTRARLSVPAAYPNRNVQVSGRRSRFFLPSIVAFSQPKRVLVCIRRSRRREVLHAKGVAGRRGLRPPRRNYFSSISCRS